MAPDDQFYIAWDGREYAGTPPDGWFLAADNRWWPPRELIDGEGPAGDTTPAAPTEQFDLNPPSPTDQTPAPPDITADPPASWAPTPTSSRPEEPQPPPHSPAGAGRRNKKRREKRKIGIGPIVLFFIILTRCNDAGEPTTVTAFVDATADDYTGTTECSRTFLSGSIVNERSFQSTFVVATARQDAGLDYQSDEISLAAGASGNWVINLAGDDRSGDFCPPTVVWVSP